MQKIQLYKHISVVHNSRNVTTVYFDNVRSGWKMSILLSSDRHHDAVKCNRELELQHLNEVARRKGFIIDLGDTFDAMQGKFDPRRSYSEIRPEYVVESYLDDIVADAAKFYAPYAKRFIVIAHGNHENGVLRHTNTDLTSNLVYALNKEHGGHVQVGGYTGWVRFMFGIEGKEQHINLKYMHGFGAGRAPVTRDVINSNREAVYEPDADIIVNGHHHESWHLPIARERLSNKGEVQRGIQHHIRTATYGDDYGDGWGGHSVESGQPPKPMGAVWLNFAYQSDKIVFTPTLDVI